MRNYSTLAVTRIFKSNTQTEFSGGTFSREQGCRDPFNQNFRAEVRKFLGGKWNLEMSMVPPLLSASRYCCWSPVAAITLHGLLPWTHNVCATYTVIHIVIVIVFVIELYHDGWSDDIDGSFTFFILHIPNYRTICSYTSLIGQHTILTTMRPTRLSYSYSNSFLLN